MLDVLLWILAVAFFFGTAVRWLLLPVAVSWVAWLGFVIGALVGAILSYGSPPVFLVSGLVLAAAGHMANGYRLAAKYGLTGRPMRDEDAEVVKAFRASGLDRRMQTTDRTPSDLVLVRPSPQVTPTTRPTRRPQQQLP